MLMYIPMHITFTMELQVLNMYSVFSPMWDWGEANGFDVDTDSTHTMHSQYADTDTVQEC